MSYFRSCAKRIHDWLFQNSVYTVRYGYFRGFKLRGRMPWFQRDVGESRDTAEMQFFETLSLHQKVFYDIGSHQGPHTFLCHRLIGRGGYVYAFEPDPVSSDILKKRIELNSLKDVDVIPFGLGDQPGQFTLVVPDSNQMQMAATLSENLKESLSEDQVLSTITVDVVRLDDWINENSPQDPDLIKIDVEGFEVQVLKGSVEVLSRANPLLFIEIHGADQISKTANSRGVMEVLAPFGYRFTHFETNQEVFPETAEKAAEGHLVCRTESTKL